MRDSLAEMMGGGWRAASNGYYEIGKAHSKVTRSRVVAIWQNEPSLTWDQLSEKAGPSVSSCKRYINQFCDGDNGMDPSPYQPNPVTKMGEDEYLSLYDIYRENPSYQLNDYKYFLQKDVGVNISESQICRILQDLRLTLKKPQIIRRERFEFRDGAMVENVTMFKFAILDQTKAPPTGQTLIIGILTIVWLLASILRRWFSLMKVLWFPGALCVLDYS